MITVVVITRNEEKNIARTLVSLSDPRISEIIVSDSNSSDRTEEFVKKCMLKDDRITFTSYKSPPFTAARGRNEGANLANVNNRLVLFLDGDMELVPGFLDSAISRFDIKKSLSAISGQMHNFYYDDNGCIINKHFNYYKIQDGKPGGAVIIRLKDFQLAGGYTESLAVNEEAEFFYRLRKVGHEFERIEDLMIIHHTEVPTSKSRIKERLFDKKITALANNFILGLKDLKYMRILIADNKFTVASAISLVLSLIAIFYYQWLSFVIIGGVYIVTSLKNKSFRVGLNYLIYGFGLLCGLIGYLFLRKGFKGARNV